MFCRRNQWEGAKFPRGLFHQSRSKRGRVLMHSKVCKPLAHIRHPHCRSARQMILGIIRDRSATSGGHSDSETEDEDGTASSSKAKEQPIGWLYMGSHNFTPSAWGTLSGSAFNPTLNVRMLSPKAESTPGLLTGLSDHELRAGHHVAGT